MMILFRRILFCLLWLWLPVSGRRKAAGCVRPITTMPAYGYVPIRPLTVRPGCCWMSNWKTAGKPTGARREGRGASIARKGDMPEVSWFWPTLAL